MNKALLTALATLLLAGLGGAFAQNQTESHPVTVKVQGALFIRVTSGANGVVFDATPSDVANAATSPTTLGADASSDLTDIDVLANQAWKVTVGASTALNIPGLTLSDIVISPSGTPGTGVNNVYAFDGTSRAIGTAAVTLADGVKTTGWSSLGIDASAFGLRLTGDEDPTTGTTIDLSYTITSNP